ncbi:MAG: transposase, partial [Bacteroidota bacterium]|nr:transposase [Bacteroidota bacterium]
MEFTQNSRFIRSIKQQDKKAWHITCSTHNSRYSQRMFDNYVKLGAPIWLSEKEELIITNTIAEIVENDKLSILAYNICGDHMHILLVCDNGKLPKIVQKIKSMSARACNIAMGRTIVGSRTREHAPSSGRTPEGGAGSSTGRTPEGGTGVATKTGDESGVTREHAPLSGRTPKNGADSSTGRTPENGAGSSTGRTPENGAGSSTGRTPEGGTGVATKTGDESGATREHAPSSGY